MLKQTLSILLVAFLIFACESEQGVESSTDTSVKDEGVKSSASEDLIVRHWVFKERVSKDGQKRIEYGDESSQRLIHFEIDGFFKIYDSITDQRILDKGVSRIEQLASGNWELKDGGKQLKLNYRNNDKVDVEIYTVSSLTNTELVTVSETKGTTSYIAK